MKLAHHHYHRHHSFKCFRFTATSIHFWLQNRSPRGGFFVGSAEAAACPRLRPRAHALAPFAGIEQDYDAAAAGWEAIAELPYSSGWENDTLRKMCAGWEHVLLGARKKDETILALCANAKLEEVFRKTDEDWTHEANGAHWYCCEKKSMGFAPSSDVILIMMMTMGGTVRVTS